MGQRDFVTIRGQDGDGEPVRRNLPGECNLARDRSANHSSAAESDVDTSMLSSRIGIVAERELTEDVAVGRPSPSVGARGASERPRDRRESDRESLCCPRSKHRSRVAASSEEEQRN